MVEERQPADRPARAHQAAILDILLVIGSTVEIIRNSGSNLAAACGVHLQHTRGHRVTTLSNDRSHALWPSPNGNTRSPEVSSDKNSPIGTNPARNGLPISDLLSEEPGVGMANHRRSGKFSRMLVGA
jgi:hypothetical protein